MSALWSLLGDKQTSRVQPISVAIDPERTCCDGSLVDLDTLYHLSVSKIHQRSSDEAADEEKPILWHVEENGSTAADQRPDKRNNKNPARGTGPIVRRSPNVKIVTGHGDWTKSIVKRLARMSRPRIA
jgi:hypothetical protein